MDNKSSLALLLWTIFFATGGAFIGYKAAAYLGSQILLQIQ